MGFKSSGGIYESVAIPLNNGLKGLIKQIKLMHKPLPAGCGFTVQVKHYGHYIKNGTPPAEDSFTTLYTSQGNTSTSGMTQSTTNSTFTVIETQEAFKWADYAQIRILFDETTGTSAPEIIFPIIINTEASASL
jgi:hypothetical protein